MYQVLCETLAGTVVITTDDDRDAAYVTACNLQARGEQVTVIDTLGIPAWEPGPLVCQNTVEVTS
jgi:hypothetical protein